MIRLLCKRCEGSNTDTIVLGDGPYEVYVQCHRCGYINHNIYPVDPRNAFRTLIEQRLCCGPVIDVSGCGLVWARHGSAACPYCSGPTVTPEAYRHATKHVPTPPRMRGESMEDHIARVRAVKEPKQMSATRRRPE